MKRSLTALALATLCLHAHAVLAPNYQRLAELKAILAEPAVIGAFDVYHPIDRIEFVRQDQYRVTAGTCHVDVMLSNDPKAPKMPGARQFLLKVGRKTCD